MRSTGLAIVLCMLTGLLVALDQFSVDKDAANAAGTGHHEPHATASRQTLSDQAEAANAHDADETEDDDEAEPEWVNTFLVTPRTPLNHGDTRAKPATLRYD